MTDLTPERLAELRRLAGEAQALGSDPWSMHHFFTATTPAAILSLLDRIQGLETEREHLADAAEVLLMRESTMLIERESAYTRQRLARWLEADAARRAK